MLMLVVQAYICLVRMDLYLIHNNFSSLYQSVRNTACARVTKAPGTTDRICRAVDLAALWYWKQVPCLQRSAATVCLLRRSGIAAVMVIGAQCIPFRAHAWVEVGGGVVNDKPYVPELYAVLDRC